MCKFESSQKDESRAQSADSSKRRIENLLELLIVLFVKGLLSTQSHSVSSLRITKLHVQYGECVNCH